MSDLRWLDLEPHPQSQGTAIKRLRFGYALSDQGWRLSYELYGDISQLDLPPVHEVSAGESLWQHSCFELFVGTESHHYREFNFAPDGRYAVYDFTGIRSDQRRIERELLAQAESWQDSKRYRLDLELADFAPPQRAQHAGACAILFDREGAQSWWALAHAPGKPDFHHPRDWIIPLT